MEQGAPPADSVGALRKELDVAQLRLMTAVDAVVGAEAERSAAESRIRELEHQHHMLKAECDVLRSEVERLMQENGGLGIASIVRRVVAMLRRGRSGVA